MYVFSKAGQDTVGPVALAGIVGAPRRRKRRLVEIRGELGDSGLQLLEAPTHGVEGLVVALTQLPGTPARPLRAHP